MFKPDYSIYLGTEEEQSFAGFVGENNLYLILALEENFDKESLRQFLKDLGAKVKEKNIKGLSEFDNFLTSSIKEANLPLNFSLSALYLLGDVVYLKTVGEGEIFLRKGSEFKKIIDKNRSASGYGEVEDFFILTTTKFSKLLDTGFDKFIDHNTPHETVDFLTPNIKGEADNGTICVFVALYEESSMQPSYVAEKEDSLLGHQNNPLQKLVDRWKAHRLRMGNRRVFTLITVGVLFFIFIWSVVLGYKRRADSQAKVKIEAARESITQKLNSAEQTAFLNISQAQDLIQQSRNELKVLQEIISDKNNKDFKELESLIAEKENKILNKEEKENKEFYDLALDQKQVDGTNIYLYKDNLAILDEKKKVIYVLSLSKKSLRKFQFAQINKAKFAAYYEDKVFFYVPTEGIYEINSQNQLKKVVDRDSAWADPTDMFVYNANIYLLDSGKNDIFKYIATDEGYSSGQSYFGKGLTLNFTKSKSLSIDSSVYVGLESTVLKYTGGVPDQFETSYPDTSVAIDKVFTNRDLDKIYVLNKKKNAVYVLEKNGGYVKQIQSSILAKAADMAVFENTLYILVGSKIYTVAAN